MFIFKNSQITSTSKKDGALEICSREGSQIKKNIKPVALNPNDVISIEPEFSQHHWAKVENGKASFWINTHNPKEQDIYISGSVHKGDVWDPFVWNMLMDIFSRHPPSEGIFVDVGANLGYFSLMAASLGYRVVAFEPMKRNMAKFASSVKRNGFDDKIKLYRLAASYISGESIYMEPTHATNSGNGRIVQNTDHGAEKAETIRLDQALNENIVAVKIDVEGHEGGVLDGTSALMCNRLVYNVIMELSDETKHNPMCPAGEMISAMLRVGYVVSDVIPGAPAIIDPDLKIYPPNILFTLQGLPFC